MELIPLTQEELEQTRPGEALTMATVMVVMTVAILAIICYKLFLSKSGKATVGDYKFEWSNAA